MLRLSIQPAVTFAAVSSSGFADSEGRRDPCAGLVQGYARGRQRGQGIDDRNGRPCQEGGRRHPHGQSLDKVPGQQHTLAPVPVAEQGGDRGEDHGRDELHYPYRPRGQPRQPRRRRPGWRSRFPTSPL